MTDKTDTREIVLDILLAVTRDGEYSHIALKNTLDKYRYLEKRERAFLTKIVAVSYTHLTLPTTPYV